MPAFAVQNGLIEGAEHEVPPAGQDGTAGVGHRRWHLAAWRGVGQRFTQHNVDQLLGRAGELGVTWSKPTSATATTSPRPTVLEEFLAGQAIQEGVEESMRRLIASEFVTLDGVMEAPGHDQHPDGKNAWALRLPAPTSSATRPRNSPRPAPSSWGG